MSQAQHAALWAGDPIIRSYRDDIRASTEAIRAASQRPRILILEDEYVEAMVFARMLRGLGHIVVQTDPRVALSLLLDDAEAGIRFDAAIVDVSLPHMSGFDFVDRVSKALAPGRMPVVLLSGLRRPPGVLPGEFVCKPSSKEEIRQALQRAVPKLFAVANGASEVG